MEEYNVISYGGKECPDFKVGDKCRLIENLSKAKTGDIGEVIRINDEEAGMLVVKFEFLSETMRLWAWRFEKIEELSNPAQSNNKCSCSITTLMSIGYK